MTIDEKDAHDTPSYQDNSVYHDQEADELAIIFLHDSTLTKVSIYARC